MARYQQQGISDTGKRKNVFEDAEEEEEEEKERIEISKKNEAMARSGKRQNVTTDNFFILLFKRQ